jgi:hypothetical protein
MILALEHAAAAGLYKDAKSIQHSELCSYVAQIRSVAAVHRVELRLQLNRYANRARSSVCNSGLGVLIQHGSKVKLISLLNHICK